MRVLVVNAGSSSLKLRLLDAEDQVVATTDLPEHGGESGDELVNWISGIGEVGAVGHRIVHGGTEFRDAVRIDSEVRARIEALTDLAGRGGRAGADSKPARLGERSTWRRTSILALSLDSYHLSYRLFVLAVKWQIEAA